MAPPAEDPELKHELGLGEAFYIQILTEVTDRDQVSAQPTRSLFSFLG